MLNTPQDVFKVVKSEIERIMQDMGRPARSVSLGDSLTSDLHLSSLMIARLIIELQERIDVDPFAETHSMADVSTVDDIVSAYVATMATAADAEPNAHEEAQLTALP